MGLEWSSHVVHSQASVHWRTPEEVYAALNREFRFDLDPCPLHAPFDGLSMSWVGRRVFCNPPYRRGEIAKWLAKHEEADLAVYLLPSRTGTKWFHDFAPKAKDVRFVRGRLSFGGVKTNAPFDSVILIFKGD